MKIDRRQLLALLPALVLGTGARAQSGGMPYQEEIEPFWPVMQALPSIRAASRGGGAPDICYMFTNRNCAVCQLVHRKYDQGFRGLEMRYVIYPYPGDSYRALNYLYRPEASEAEYDAYMQGRLTAVSASDSPARTQQVLAAGASLARQLIEGDVFGTPFFFYAAGAGMPGARLFTVGDIAAMEPLLDRVAI